MFLMYSKEKETTALNRKKENLFIVKYDVMYIFLIKKMRLRYHPASCLLDFKGNPELQYMFSTTREQRGDKSPHPLTKKSFSNLFLAFLLSVHFNLYTITIKCTLGMS